MQGHIPDDDESPICQSAIANEAAADEIEALTAENTRLRTNARAVLEEEWEREAAARAEAEEAEEAEWRWLRVSDRT